MIALEYQVAILTSDSTVIRVPESDTQYCNDRLHSTAHSHHRIIVVEIMGHNAGWLALGAGVAGGADVILIPEIPYGVMVAVDGNMTKTVPPGDVIGRENLVPSDHSWVKSGRDVSTCFGD